MHLKSDNIEIMMGIETDDIINVIFEYSSKKISRRIRNKKEKKWFVFESIDLLCFGLHKMSLNRGESYIDSPDWIKNKKATINPKSKDNKYLRDGITAALNHEKIKYNPERISNIKLFLISIIGEDRVSITLKRLEKGWTKQSDNCA